jgi:hypothetical protein
MAEVATPLELVVAVLAPPAKVPLAPEAGAVNVTTIPLAGDPPLVTVATKGAENAVLTSALCGVPLVAAIDSTGGVVELDPPPQAVRRARRMTQRTLAQALRSIVLPPQFTPPQPVALRPSNILFIFIVISKRGFVLQRYK